MSDPDVVTQRARVQRRTLTVVVIAQILGGAGLAAGITVGALLAEEMLGGEGLAGVPIALFTLGAALSAYLVGRLCQRSGRRIGLGLGFSVGGLGAIGIVVAAAIDNVPLLLLTLFVYGAGSATNLQSRYAGADLALPHERGRAISLGLFSTTFGAVAGPNLVGPMGRFAEHLDLPALSGPFVLAAAAYLAAGVTYLLFLRPDPLLLARRLELAQAAAEPVVAPGPVRMRRGVWVGAIVMITTQIAMAAIMTMTPVHMKHHHHDLSAVGLVIGLHIAAMYLPSPITGVLVDRIGRTAMAAAAGIVLLIAGVTGALAPGGSLAWMIVALMLLGLGWNLGLIAGTAMLVDATDQAERPRVQGSVDVLIALAGAGGGALSGVVVAASSFGALSVASGLLALALVPVLGRRTFSGSQSSSLG